MLSTHIFSPKLLIVTSVCVRCVSVCVSVGGWVAGGFVWVKVDQTQLGAVHK